MPRPILSLAVSLFGAITPSLAYSQTNPPDDPGGYWCRGVIGPGRPGWLPTQVYPAQLFPSACQRIQTVTTAGDCQPGPTRLPSSR